MWTLHTTNAEHWVPIKTVGSFKRMREFQPLGHDWLVSALRTSLELEVDESGTNVRRRTEVTEPKGQFERSIYAVSHRRYILEIRGDLANFCRKGLERSTLGCKRTWKNISTRSVGSMLSVCVENTRQRSSRLVCIGYGVLDNTDAPC